MLKFKFYSQVHQIMGLFFLPLVLIFIVTGFFSILGFDKVKPILEERIELKRSDSWPKQQEKIKFFLNKNGYDETKGELRDFRTQIMWGESTGLHGRVFFEDNNDNGALIKIYQPNLYYKLLGLHKDRAGKYFKYFSILFCLSYLLIYLFGFLMVVRNKKTKRNSLIVFLSGCLLFMVLFYFNSWLYW